MNEHLLEPLKFYETLGKSQHEDNVRAHFDALLDVSKVNVEENRATVKAYKHELALIEGIEKKISKYKIFKVLLIIASFLVITSLSHYFLILKKIKPLINDAEKLRESHEARASELLSEAEAQMAPLNALFRDDDALKIIEKTVPDIDFTERFDEHLREFVARDDTRPELDSIEASVIGAIPGRFAKNPFVFIRRLVHRLGIETYHGSLVISWTETYRDSEGRMRTRRRTQTLHASVTKPKPFYNNETFLCYSNQAAPDLSFSRIATDVEELNEKQIERRVKKGKKKLEKKARAALESGKNFQEMSNTEFDVLFGATDRDHEVQFRLMFTPLAQRNMISLLKENAGYGDDFSFTKKKELNIIKSEHSQDFTLFPSASYYRSYDVDVAKKNFEDFNNNYFKAVFFDFAPLFSIPAYLEEPAKFLTETDEHAPAFSYLEHEQKANSLGAKNFAHGNSNSAVILKTRCIKTSGGTDDVEVNAYSYATAARVDLIPVMGGDGRLHSVPVHWTEYIPLENASVMRITPDGKASIL